MVNFKRLFILTFVAMLCSTAFALRIVSTAPGLTETLFALGAIDDVIAVSSYCKYPEQVNDLPKVGGFYDINHEIILRLSPDIVFLMDGNAELGRFLDKHKIKYSIYMSHSLEDVYAMIEGVGEKVGKQSKADELVDDIKERMAETKKVSSKKNKQSVLLVIEEEVHNKKVEAVYAVGRDKYYVPILEALNLNNVLDTAIPYPRITKETLYGLKPDKIIVMVSGKPEHYDWLAREGYAPDVSFIEDDVVKHPGPRIIDTLEIFNEIVSHN